MGSREASTGSASEPDFVASDPASGIVHPERYRGDIDGLRAIAVGSVILFHMVPRHFKAGGIGVDIFFVISGYLIGGIILASLDRGHFSFAEFYLRRVRRIAPAMLATLIATLLVGLYYLFPAELLRLAWNALAAFGCVSNVYLYATTNYFAPNSAFLPLLHTWTLAVEEQFYVVTPILASLIYRAGGRRHVTAIFAVGLILSFAISQYQVTADGPAAFYLLPSRAWELMLGVIAARAGTGWARTRFAREIVAAAGLALIAGSLALLDPAAGFPGWRAVPPCVGAAMLLVAGAAGPSLVGRMLSIRPMRAVGLASYSLYLWHWPAIVFLLREKVQGKLSVLGVAEALAITAVLGFASWRFVERPFRRRDVTAAALLRSMAAMAAALLAIIGAIVVTRGLPTRIPPRVLEIAGYERASADFAEPEAHCFLQVYETLAAFDRARCLAPAPGARNWLLFGDSHAAMLYGGLRRAYPDIHWSSAVVLGCELRLWTGPDGTGCADLTHLVVQRILPKAPVEGVVLSSRWQFVDPTALARLAAMLRARGIRLVLVGPVPEYSVPIARLLAEAEWRHRPDLGDHLIADRVWATDAQLAALGKSLGFEYLSAARLMCPGRRGCILADAAGHPIYSDESHYNDQGSYMLLERWKRSRGR